MPRLRSLPGPALLWAALLAAASLLSSAPAPAADWINSGGNPGRNALSPEIGPAAQDLLWSGGRSSLIAWHPVTEGNRAFLVRQLRWPDQQPGDSPVVAMDLTTGEELWAVDLPYNTGDWTAWVAGARDGKVYASRSGNGASIAAKIYALDAADGHTVWASEDLVKAGPYDGVVFTAEGDLIVGSLQDLWRIDAVDGTTVWHQNRVGSVSSAGGAAVYGGSAYIADVTGGGHIMVRYDLETGARLYQSPVMPGFTCENTPMAGPDGTLYLNRAQNNASVDFLYAFTDDGAQFVEKWHVPAAYNPYAELGIGPDGSVYAVVPGPRLVRLDPATGAELNSTPVLSGFSKSRFAIDAHGIVYFSNGSFATGLLSSFDADLTPRWQVAVTNINIGGPSLGENGTLLVCGVGSDVRAYRTVDPAGLAGPALAGLSAGAIRIIPNPVRDRATIRFNAAPRGLVSLALYDVGGHRMRSFGAALTGTAGRGSVTWDGRDDSGLPLPSGVYQLRLISGGSQRTARLLLTR